MPCRPSMGMTPLAVLLGVLSLASVAHGCIPPDPAVATNCSSVEPTESYCACNLCYGQAKNHSCLAADPSPAATTPRNCHAGDDEGTTTLPRGAFRYYQTEFQGGGTSHMRIEVTSFSGDPDLTVRCGSPQGNLIVSSNSGTWQPARQCRLPVPPSVLSQHLS